MDYSEFGTLLTKLRKSKNISQSTLAQDLHISRATISNFENGSSSDIGFKKVLQIFDYFGFDLDLKTKSPFPVFEDLVDGHHSADLLFQNSEYILNYTTQNTKEFVSLTMPVRQKSYTHKLLHPAD